MSIGNKLGWSLHDYRTLLQSFLRDGYSSHSFASYLKARESHKTLVVRHDIDFDLAAAYRMARADFELGIKSTFFLRVCARGYNLFSYDGLVFLNQLKKLDREIGLHVDIGMDRILMTDPEDSIERQLSCLESIYGDDVIGLAAHTPGTLGGLEICDRFVDSGRVSYHAYQTRFTKHPFKYLSDSMRIWREGNPYLIGKQYECIQLLTHPIWWHEIAPQENY